MRAEGRTVARRLLALVGASYLALALAFGVLNPVFEAPDETVHYQVIRYLIRNGTLPSAAASPDENLAFQEASQPPLYYVAGALLTGWIQTGDQTAYEINPHVRLGAGGKLGNVNLVVHGGEDERFPYGGHPLAVHVLRVYSTLLGLGTVICVFLAARRVLRAESLAAGAAALVAFLPQFVFISASVNNDNLSILASAFGLWLCTAIVERPGARRFLALGVVLGIAALAKASALPLFLSAGVAALLAARSSRSRRPLLLGAMAYAVAAGISAWWFARNLSLYGDPLGFVAHLRYMGGRGTPFGPAEFWGELEGLRHSFFAVFGWFNVTTDPALHLVFAAVLLAAAGGLAAGAFVRPDTWRQTDAAGAFLLAFHAVVVCAGFIYWTAMIGATQGRLLFTALPAFAIFAVLGLSTWGGKRLGWLYYTTAALAFCGATAWALANDVLPAYARPPAPVEAEVLAGSRQRYANFGEAIALLGYRLSAEEVPAGEVLDLTLYWRALARMDTNYSVFVHVADDPKVRVAEVNSYPGLGNNPTRYWQPGELARDTFSLRVKDGSPPGSYKVLLGFYDFATGSRLTLPDGSDWVVLQEITVSAPLPPAL